ncbi:acyltransferase [Vitiosangium sp. GDMCC 1.1324]|uniref:acyltransferase family protein n=1 Tax=Vitiosangium sp. (strain GDMCC 1.1324) TaxID=2138576 RepID=UPI00130D5D56|nr:acyltransferase [Vitiosangium sp. GDMCC 1.1324]
MSSRLPGLDGLRALSVVLVILHHAVGTEGFPRSHTLERIAEAGNIGVQVFFVISGFLITWLLLGEEEKTGRIDLKGFYYRRALRILPPAFVYLAVVAVVANLRDTPIAMRELLSAALFVRNLGPVDSTYTRHYWSLAIEEQFYLVWPLLLMWLPRRARLWATAGLICAEPVWRQANTWLLGAAHVNWVRMDLRYSGLLLGALFALVRKEPRLKAKLDRLLAFGPWLFVAAGVALVALLATPLDAQPRLFRVDPELLKSLLIVVPLVVLVEGRGGMFSSVFELAPIRWVGRISYSLYLWQQLFCTTSSGPWFERFPLNVLASFALAAASYYFIEQPVLRWRDRRSQKPTLPPAQAPSSN